ncbi:hypothetical protein RUE5091_00494 [Ruegeria denitrificans]|uniref:DUF4177 domain-containing protein n=1 Tax=Ruegeria denitrificans TaxID=1715692 RepID=A0A0N7M8E1_9RHOB|nr:DUF4177 domain-containing protein [Ruegeria denitrificans]CUJ86659.1 hypothetical protein RUE5091_00494 [Ruegeria denitrificans]
MQRYEYKVVPAPQKGTKAKGVKSAEGRFAASVEQVLNEMGQDGWEYRRAELLPSEERAGLTGSTVNWRNVLVFRRELEDSKTLAPVETTDTVAVARSVPGPGNVVAPAPISEEAKEPPLFLRHPEQEDTENPEKA